MSLRWLPNAISIMRIVLIAPILVLITRGEYGWALALFWVAGFSDGLDGYLAVRHVLAGCSIRPPTSCS